jgi:ATP-dependent Clp protease ATP-binding subunit ClpC
MHIIDEPERPEFPLGAIMYERFTDRSRRVMELAHDEAGRRKRLYLRTSDILVGLIRENQGLAAHAICFLGLQPSRVLEEIEIVSQLSCAENEVAATDDSLQCRKAIDCAHEALKDLGHNYIGTEHLLLGIARVDEGIAAKVLLNLGVEFDDVTEIVYNILGHALR